MSVQQITSEIGDLNIAERHEILQHILRLNRQDMMSLNLDAVSRRAKSSDDEGGRDIELRPLDFSLGEDESAQESMALLKEIWAELPEGAGDVSDEEIDRLKVEWRLEKYG